MKTIQKHLQDGTYNVTRHGGKLVSEPVNEAPPPPADIPPAARPIWETEVNQLFELRTISTKDLPALRELVMNVFYMREAEKSLAKHGMTMIAETKAGPKPVSNPAWRQFQDAQKVVIALRKEFGVTPLSGQRFGKPEPDSGKPDPFDVFLKMGQTSNNRRYEP